MHAADSDDTLPAALFLSASDPVRQGFARVINHSPRGGTARVVAVDDAGRRSDSVTIALEAGRSTHFNSNDLELGNTRKGLTGSTGAGQGDWRLELSSELDIEVLAYVRTPDGFLTSIHERVPRAGDVYRVGIFNPGSNLNQQSLLRLVNPGPETLIATITGIDDRGTPSRMVTVELPPGVARAFTSAELESGDATGLEGSLGDGSGKWRLDVASDREDRDLVVMSLLSSPTGHVTNLSPQPVDRTGSVHAVPLFPAASNAHQRQGFVRVVNRSDVGGEVSIVAFDGTGTKSEALTLSVGAKAASHFNSDDLELGNPGKGLTGSTGPGHGDWRLELASELDIEVLAYVRTPDGFLTSIHETVPRAGDVYRVGIFNPGGNLNQQSLLRLVNPGSERLIATITGIDDRGTPSRMVTVELPPGVARAFTSAELESGDAAGLEGSLGDGSGKWRLDVASDREDRDLVVMSLLSSPTGHLTNLSAAGAKSQAEESAQALFRARVSPIIQSKCIGCHVADGESGNTRLVFLPETDKAHLNGNLEVFKNFLDEVEGGAAVVLDKIDGQSHGGGVQAPVGTGPYADMQRFLGMLGTDTVETRDLDTLLAEVDEIARPGTPGPLCVYGPNSFPVIVGSAGDASVPVIAGGRWQAGRVVALGHDGYFDRSTLATADTGRLLTNALQWASGKDAPDSPRIGVVGKPELLAWLTEGGHDAANVALTAGSLGEIDVVALTPGNQNEAEIDVLSAFVRRGGGLVMAATGWGWAQQNPSKELVEDYVGNQLLAPVGIQWSAAEDAYGTSAAGYAAPRVVSNLTHGGGALDAIAAIETATQDLTTTQIAQALDSVIRTIRCLPADDDLVAPRVRALVHRVEPDDWPSAQTPVSKNDVFARVAVAAFTVLHEQTPPESVTAHPAAADFPGSVPAEAERLLRRITIDTAAPRWKSTGLYAAPGEPVTVRVPTEVAEAGGFGVRIGAHSDGIWPRPDWTRMPEISRRFAIESDATLVANAFGGLIYVDVPEGIDLGSIEVEIEGAVAAPRFVLNETDPDLWRETIRHAPGPWAEIEGQDMIVTTRASEVRDLDDPGAVAIAWDRVVDLCAELAAWPQGSRSNQERFVVDRQISVGYMHNGYPIMAHLDQQANIVDADHLRLEGNWGFFHEVGHNHQNYDWTFHGTVEVTVNLFTLYVYENLVGIPVAENYRGSQEFRASQMARYNFDAPDFEQWKRDPLLALVMYVQLQQAFGWDAYRRVFETYLALPDADRPKNDTEKRDQWMVRFSEEVGHNLGPFFEAWGVPTSQAARESIRQLPEWLPPNFPPTSQQ